MMDRETKTAFQKIPGWVLGSIIFIAALVFRVIYINQLGQTYFFSPFKGGFDDYVFDNWALEMLKGNWIGDPAIFIYRMPLYAFFLWFVYFLFGHSYLAVYIIQAVIAAASCTLVYAIGSRLAGRQAGLAAGLLSALYGVSIYYTGMLVGETLGIFISLLSFNLILAFQEREKLRFLLLGGIFFGISMLARGNMIVILPVLILWIVYLYGHSSIRKTLTSALILLLGVMLSLMPVIIRNYTRTKDIVPISAQGGLNVYIGNAYGADGKFRAIDGIGGNLEEMIPASIKIAQENMARPLKPSQVSDYWVKETFRSINNHGGIWTLAPLMIKKVLLFWNAYELPDIWDYYFFKNYIPILRFPLVNFALIGSLALAGMYLAWPRKRKLSLLYIFVLGYMVSLVLVFITSRYRFPIVPFLAIFAGIALQAFLNIKDTGAYRATVGAIIFLLALIFCNIGAEKISFATSHNSLGILLKRDGRISEAVSEYKKAARIAPSYPSPYYNLGILYRDEGQAEEAVYYFKKALEADPNFELARKKLAELI